MEFSNFVLV